MTWTELELTESMWHNYVQSLGPEGRRLRPFKTNARLRRRLQRDWGARIRWKDSAVYHYFDEPRPQYDRICFDDAQQAMVFALRYG